MSRLLLLSVVTSLLWLWGGSTAKAQEPLELLWVRTNAFGYLLPTSTGFVTAGYDPAAMSRAWLRLDAEAEIVDVRHVGRPDVGGWYPMIDGLLVLDLVQKSGANHDVFLKKLSLQGATLWTNYVSTVWFPPMPQTPVLPLPDGSSIVIPSNSGRFLHFAADGGLIFSSPILDGQIRDVTVSPTGYYAAGGGLPNLDFMLWSIQPDGAVRWQRTFGGNGAEEVERVIYSEAERAVYLAGHSTSGRSGDKTADSKGGADFWLVKVWGNGDKAWDAAFGGAGAELHPDMTLLGPAIVLAGQSSSEPDGMNRTSPSLRGSGTTDGWIVIVDNAGNKRAESSIPLAQRVNGRHLQVAPMRSGDLLLREFNILRRFASPFRVRIAQSPLDKVAVPGRPVIFTAAAQSAFEPPAYQWFFKGAPLTGATNAALSIAAIGPEHVGEYYVVARNSVSEARSASAALSLTDAEVRVRMHPSLEIYGLANRNYTIERTVSGSSTAWEVADTITLTNSPQVWVDTSLNLPDKRLYRVKLTP